MLDAMKNLYIFPKLVHFSLVYSLLSLTVNIFVCGRAVLPPNITISAVIVFGDSVLDSGNNNNLNTLIKSNFPPYGRDFTGGIPTGRFSNGRIPSDMIAEELGVKTLVPAYLDSNLTPEDLLTGVTFASGGSGYDPLTSVIVAVLSLDNQLRLFKEYISKLNSLVGEEKTKSILANSLFLIESGNDDIANTYFAARARQVQYDIPSYTSLMVDHATSFLKQIYALGARRIAVLSTPPLGCIPSSRTLAGGLRRSCAAQYNEASRVFNTKLKSHLDHLNEILPGARVVYTDIYTPLFDIVQNYQKYGFADAAKGCCGSGLIEVVVLCNQFAPHTCPDASKYVFWDSYHPTERTYEILVNLVLPGAVRKMFG